MERPQHHRIINEVRNHDGSVRFTLQYNPKIFDEAKCRGLDTDLFYPNQEKFSANEEHYISSRLCGGCPVKDACLEWGLVHEKHGIWGGFTPYRRKLMRRVIKWALNDIALPSTQRR